MMKVIVAIRSALLVLVVCSSIQSEAGFLFFRRAKPPVTADAFGNAWNDASWKGGRHFRAYNSKAREVVVSDPEFKQVLDSWMRLNVGLPKAMKKYPTVYKLADVRSFLDATYKLLVNLGDARRRENDRVKAEANIRFYKDEELPGLPRGELGDQSVPLAFLEALLTRAESLVKSKQALDVDLGEDILIMQRYNELFHPDAGFIKRETDSQLVRDLIENEIRPRLQQLRS